LGLVSVKAVPGNSSIRRLSFFIFLDGQSNRFSNLFKLAKIFNDFEIQNNENSELVSSTFRLSRERKPFPFDSICLI